jgi:hypothetical protein
VTGSKPSGTSTSSARSRKNDVSDRLLARTSVMATPSNAVNAASRASSDSIDGVPLRIRSMPGAGW